MSSLFKKVWGTSSAAADKKGGRKAARTSEMTIDSIESLTQKEQHLEKRRELIEKKIETELENAKHYQRQNKKSQALMCLKKKKMYEKNMDDLGNLIMKVNEQKILLENAQTTAETLKALEGATKASKNILINNKIEDVDQLMEDIAAETDVMRDINERIAEPSPFLAEYDDDDLLDELKEMEAEMIDEELTAPNIAPALPTTAQDLELPSVPATAATVKPMTSEEKELEALAAELA